jgi:hypothetical protein
VNANAPLAGQFEVRSAVRMQPGGTSRERTWRASEGEPVQASYRVSTPTEIQRTHLRAAHRPSSLGDDIAALASLDAMKALKWFGAGAAFCALVVTSVLALTAIAEESDRPSTARPTARRESRPPTFARDPSVHTPPPVLAVNSTGAKGAPLGVVGPRAPDSSPNDFEIP